MALNKTRATRFGVTAKYWKIATVKIDWTRSRAVAEMRGFITQAQRNVDIDSNIDQETFIFDGLDFPVTHDGNNVAELYAKIKTEEDWSNATDV
jgi:hypothetical protein